MLWSFVLLATQVITTADRSESQGSEEKGKTASILSTDYENAVRTLGERATHAEDAMPLSGLRENLLKQLGKNTSEPSSMHGQALDAKHGASFIETAKRESIYLKPSGHQVLSLQVPNLDPPDAADGAPDGTGEQPQPLEALDSAPHDSGGHQQAVINNHEQAGSGESKEEGQGDENLEQPGVENAGIEDSDEHRNGAESVVEADEAVGATLGGLYVFLLCFFALTVYMLNFPDPQVKSYSHKAIHFCVCIFCTLLTTECIKNSLQLAIAPILGENAYMFTTVVLFLSWYSLISILGCRLAKTMPDEIFPTLSMVGHLAAFSLIEPFVEEEYEYALEWKEEYGSSSVISFYLAAVLIVVVVLIFQQRMASMIREKAGLVPVAENSHSMDACPKGAHLDGTDSNKGSGAGNEGDDKDAVKAHDHDERGHSHEQHQGLRHEHHHCHWLAEIIEAENEVLALIVGKLVYVLAYSLAAMNVYSPVCSGHAICPTDTTFKVRLWACMATSSICTWFLGVLKCKKQEAGQESPVLELLEGVFRASTAFLMHSCSYNIFARQVTPPGGRAGRRFLSAAASTPMAFASIIFLDFLEDNGIMNSSGVEELAKAIGMYIGFEWEDAFSSGNEAFEEYSEWVHPIAVKWLTAGILCAFVVPVWRIFVVPVASLPVPH